MSKLESIDSTLHQYLQISAGALYIPYSQRPYEWTKTQVKRLFDDLITLNNDNVDIHMLNFFTISKEEGNRSIFDGQQRTITLLLFFGVIAEKLKDLGDESAWKEIMEGYIIKKGSRLKGGSDQYKLLFDESLSQAQEQLYKLLEDPKHTKKPESNIDSIARNTINSIFENYVLLKGYLDEYLEPYFVGLDNAAKSEFIVQLFNKILEKAQLIVIETETDELAMSMFETLNNTGKKLESFFVLKNDIISILGEDNVKDIWNNIESSLDGIQYNKFLNAFVTIHRGKVSEAKTLVELYNTYDKSNITEMENLIDKLDDSARLYRYVAKPSSILDNTNFDKKLVEEYYSYAEAIGIFNVKQHFPILLAMFLKEYNLEEIIRVEKVILDIAISKFYFGNEKANTVEKLLAGLSKDIYQNHIKTDIIVEQIQKELPSQQVLKINIERHHVKSINSRIKYILKEAYNQRTSEIKIIQNPTKIHYEHILPQKISSESDWNRLFSSSEHEEYVTYIGNATLLLDNKNIKAKNNDFKYKKEIYKSSEIVINQEIAEKYDIWDKAAINKRNKEMANMIIEYLDTMDPK